MGFMVGFSVEGLAGAINGGLTFSVIMGGDILMGFMVGFSVKGFAGASVGGLT